MVSGVHIVRMLISVHYSKGLNHIHINILKCKRKLNNFATSSRQCQWLAKSFILFIFHLWGIPSRWNNSTSIRQAKLKHLICDLWWNVSLRSSWSWWRSCGESDKRIIGGESGFSDGNEEPPSPAERAHYYDNEECIQLLESVKVDAMISSVMKNECPGL